MMVICLVVSGVVPIGSVAIGSSCGEVGGMLEIVATPATKCNTPALFSQDLFV